MSSGLSTDLNFGIDRILNEPEDSGKATAASSSKLSSCNFSVPYYSLLTNYNFLPTSSITGDLPATDLKVKLESMKEISRRTGHPYRSRAPPKHKKLNTSFTKEQVALLEERFEVQKYLTSEERTLLAKVLQMTESQVKTWFQNRRTKWRRQEAEEKQCAEKASARLLYSRSHNVCMRSPIYKNC